mmetsp:Transcript_5115/g.8870  ORF Transcript_5115/g.8870 Transcript_5115/m.8870 type:complete len:134 (-) Transcript_5115:60-461(-)
MARFAFTDNARHLPQHARYQKGDLAQRFPNLFSGLLPWNLSSGTVFAFASSSSLSSSTWSPFLRRGQRSDARRRGDLHRCSLFKCVALHIALHCIAHRVALHCIAHCTYSWLAFLRYFRAELLPWFPATACEE